MSCSILNSTPFRASTFPDESIEGAPTQVLIVKGTWQISVGRLLAPHHQAPIRFMDETIPLGDLPLDVAQRVVISGRESEDWVRYESDYCPPKDRFDLIVNAWIQCAGNRYSRMESMVDFDGRRLMTLIARAPRVWIPGLLAPVIKELSPDVCKVPAFNVFAYGGPANRPVPIAELPQGTASKVIEHWHLNQEGMGYCTSASQSNAVPLPWVESSKSPIHFWSDRPPVTALGHISRADQSRQRMPPDRSREQDVGNVKEHSVDRGHFNSAPRPLQLNDAPQPGSVVDLWNLSQSGHCRFQFPDIHLWAMGEDRAGRRRVPVKLVWDTLLLEPELDSAELVWRAELTDPGHQLSSITLIARSGGSN